MMGGLGGHRLFAAVPTAGRPVFDGPGEQVECRPPGCMDVLTRHAPLWTGPRAHGGSCTPRRRAGSVPTSIRRRGRRLAEALAFDEHGAERITGVLDTVDAGGVGVVERCRCSRFAQQTRQRLGGCAERGRRRPDGHFALQA